jgi:dTDP-4-dehydrorhamnose 3,5-epimerase
LQISPTELPGIAIVRATIHEDGRGLFARTFDAATFKAAGLPDRWQQCNTSWNAHKGTLRGLHVQAAPFLEAKLVRCTRGRIYDVALDLRPKSPTYRRWFAAELSESNRQALAVPAGCAHGFMTLEDNCEVFYMMSEVHVSELSGGVRWNDPSFAIEWPTVPKVISERDQNWPDFRP